jgi:TolB-like protein
MSLVTELKRRKVFRVAVVYAATGFVVLQAADLTLPRLGVPDWGMSLIVVLLLAGFAVALVLAWVLELTPDGVRVTAPSPAVAAGDDAPVPSLLGRRTLVATAILVAVGIGLGAGLFLGTSPTPPPPALEAEAGAASSPAAADRSIAVLPFDDLSPARDQEWFSDGLTEEILNSLARLGEIRVSARNSSFQFKNRAVDVREVGRQLGVANVLEGSVRRAGDQLRITAQLIRAEDGFHLWSQAYDRHLDDVFAVQLDIAENIARVLDIFLDGARRERMVASGTRDPTAFLHYLRGRAEYEAAHQLGLDTNDRLWDANAWFDRALEVDPHYAIARFYHKDAYYHALVGDITVPHEYLRPDGSPDIVRLERLMRADLDQALASAAGTSLSRGLALYAKHIRGEWDGLAAAVAAFDPAAAVTGDEILDGGYMWDVAMIVRQFNLMREIHRGRLQRDRLDAVLWSEMVDLELFTGNVAAAERQLARATELGLEHRYLDRSRVRVLIATGRAEEVLGTMLPRFDEATEFYWWAAARGHAELGNIEAARAILHREDLALILKQGRCWLLARIGDQPEANACAAAFDARPLGWVGLTRAIIEGGSVPFDLEATPRFAALYRASGAPAWPRTEPVSRRASP